MRPKLKHSVGPKGSKNDPADVRVIQELLNENLGLLIPYAPLVVNGDVTPGTVALIEAFQRRVVGLRKPDGRVDPGGTTWKKLLEILPRDRPAHVDAFITMLLPAAQDAKKKWRVPISVLIAQAALESGWGRSVVDNAYFGIKGKAPDGSSTTFATTEVIGGEVVKLQDTFRAYKDVNEAADDYGRFLSSNSRYSPCFAVADRPIEFVKKLAAAGYATDPDYAKKLTSIINTYQLEAYDR